VLFRFGGAALSFHETKNVVSGEGGALLINRPDLCERAEIVRDKGTDRSRFFRGEVDKYSWVDLGSSYALSELSAAFLWAQLEAADELNGDRMRTWQIYHERLAPFEEAGLLRRPIVPPGVEHNAHIYYVLMPDLATRTAVLDALARAEVNAVFHYVPLHSSEAGKRYGRPHGDLRHTESAADRLIRLPLWSGMSEGDAARVVDALAGALRGPVRAAAI